MTFLTSNHSLEECTICKAYRWPVFEGSHQYASIPLHILVDFHHMALYIQYSVITLCKVFNLQCVKCVHCLTNLTTSLPSFPKAIKGMGLECLKLGSSWVAVSSISTVFQFILFSLELIRHQKPATKIAHLDLLWRFFLRSIEFLTRLTGRFVRTFLQVYRGQQHIFGFFVS